MKRREDQLDTLLRQWLARSVPPEPAEPPVEPLLRAALQRLPVDLEEAPSQWAPGASWPGDGRGHGFADLRGGPASDGR